MQKTGIIAARYVRNSDPSKKDSEVQKAQADALKAYGEKMGYECPDNLLYADAVSALKHPYWERPALMRSWDDAERGMFQIVLCTEFFRIARTTAEQYAVIEYFKRFKVELISITEKFEDTPEGNLMFMLQGWLGTLEANKIAIRTARGKDRRAARALTGQGKYPTYGYSWIDGEFYTRERYIINPAVIYIDDEGNGWTEVRVIEFCYDLCLSGESTYQIAFALTRMGIPTPRGNKAWDPSSVRKILSNICYTGEGYNGKYSDEPTRLPDGIYPRIISPELFDAVQRQLALNTEMSIRNNKHPKDGLLRGLIYCGLDNHKMQVKHFNRAGKRHLYTKAPEYCCYQNNGLDDLINHHTVVINLANMDQAAWEFVVPYIKDRVAMRKHINSLKDQVSKRNHSEGLQKEVERLNKSIANLYALVAVADPNDTDGMEAFKKQLVALQTDKREKEQLLGNLVGVEQKQEKFLAALDRFETWTDKIRPFLDNPEYEVSWEDKREAMLVMGVKVVVFPANCQFPHRYTISVLPPDIARFCDYDFTK